MCLILYIVSVGIPSFLWYKSEEGLCRPFFWATRELAEDFIFFGVGAGFRKNKPHGMHG